MSKKFRDWREDYEVEGVKFKKRDGKRYDKKKDKIRNARKNKRKLKNAWLNT